MILKTLFNKLAGKHLDIDLPDFIWLKEYLQFYGDIPAKAKPTDIAKAIDALRPQVRKVVKHIKAKGLVDPLFIQTLQKLHRCPHRHHKLERQAARQRGSWGLDTLRYFRKGTVAPHLTAKRQDEILRHCADLVEAVCNLKFHAVRSASKADLVIDVSLSRSLGFGRRGGTLGSCQLPPRPAWGKGMTVSQRQLLGDLDQAEPWDETLYFRVCLHEFFCGHFLGMRHYSGSGRSVMEAFLWPYDGLQNVDKKRLVDVYGKALTPPDEPQPPTSNKRFELVVDGQKRTERFDNNVELRILT